MKTRKRVLVLMMIFILCIFNVGITSATGTTVTLDNVTESTEEVTIDSDISVTTPNISGNDEGEKTEELSNEEGSIPAGVWSDKAPVFTEDEPMVSRQFRAARATGAVPTYQEAYSQMIALKDQYPEGLRWTNFEPYGSKGNLGDAYTFRGGAIKGANKGVGCAAFAFIMSDAAFGNLPARTIDAGSFNYEDIKVGDILRVNNNSHFVVVLQVSSGGIIVAESNYNKSVHWGRAISKEDVMNATFLVTRYPVGYSEASNPEETAYEGSEGTLQWKISNAGILTLSGTGNMMDYTTDNRPSWENYNDNINTVVIDKGITSIGNYAFYGSSALTAYLPEGVNSIGTGAFQGSNLTEITIPSTTKVVGNEAFRNCSNLVSASISEGVETIGDNAFRGCTSVTYLDFPSSVTSVGAGAFTSCERVAQIRFAPGTEKVTIGDGAFAQCWYLRSVTLPQGLEKISNDMFQSCTLLSEIYISKNVQSIGMNPFTSTYIQYGGIIYFGGSEATWKSIGGQFILNAMPNAQIQYNVEFDDPFAVDPDDPGDFKPEDESSKGETESSKGETESSKGETETSKGETESSKGETESSKGETESSKMETETSKGETESNKGENETSKGGTEGSKGETETSKGGTESSKFETETSKGGTESSKGETETSKNELKTSESSKTNSNTGNKTNSATVASDKTGSTTGLQDETNRDTTSDNRSSSDTTSSDNTRGTTTSGDKSSNDTISGDKNSESTNTKSDETNVSVTTIETEEGDVIDIPEDTDGLDKPNKSFVFLGITISILGALAVISKVIGFAKIAAWIKAFKGWKK